MPEYLALEKYSPATRRFDPGPDEPAGVEIPPAARIEGIGRGVYDNGKGRRMGRDGFSSQTHRPNHPDRCFG